MIEKYYTPSIEEFRIGFKYEKFNKHGDEWEKMTNFHGFGVFDEDHDDMEDNYIRVKYLDKQDIESCGFKVTNIINDELSEFRSIENIDNDSWIELSYYLPDRGLSIFGMYTGKDRKPLFLVGTIRNISELKVLLTQLNIKHD